MARVATALAALVLAVGPAHGWAHADSSGPGAAGADVRAAATNPAPGSKKQALLTAKQQALTEVAADPDAAQAERRSWQRQLDRRIGAAPGAVISIRNNWTHEVLPVAVADVVAREGGKGRKPGEPVIPRERVDEFLHCHFTNQPARMDERLIQTLVAAAVHFGVTRVEIISGFRSPKYNMILRKKGREVSRTSRHTRGMAVDFRLPGISTERLHAWAKRLRLGGVGRYLRSGFIHIDTDRVRYWDGR